MSRKTTKADVILQGAAERLAAAKGTMDQLGNDFAVAQEVYGALAQEYAALEKALARKPAKATPTPIQRQPRRRSTSTTLGGKDSPLKDVPVTAVADVNGGDVCAIPNCGLGQMALVHAPSREGGHRFRSSIKVKNRPVNQAEIETTAATLNWTEL